MLGNILHIFITSSFSLVVLFALTKLIGNRQMSQMSMFDYINGITIGSIAAEFATSLEGDFILPLVAMLVYGLAVLGISLITCKSLKLRKFFNGKPLVLYEAGTLYEANLQQAHLDINEFLTQCRVKGFFDLSQLQAAFLETNGEVSLMPTAQQRPVTPQDLQMQLPPEAPTATVIVDGILLSDNLRQTGNNDVWLYKQLQLQSVALREVFLATCDVQNTLRVYRRSKERKRREIFE